LASQKKVARYSQKKLKDAVDFLAELRQAPEDVSKVSEVLRQAGVQLVYVEPISGSKIDGACTWIGDKPVVGMTLRFDRVDNFWFVLRHELEHVLNEDGKSNPVLDTEMGEDNADQPKCERLANAAAAEFCTPQEDLDRFVDDVSPYFSEEKVLAFAAQVKVHPGLVVGQLHRRLNRHDFLRKHQVKIRQFALQSALADGWGLVPAGA
jgi:HTH-type transcriptional regulator/antitoxin HigA